MKQLLEQKIAALDRRTQEMQTLRHALSRYMALCQQALEQGSIESPCPVLLDLLQESADETPRRRRAHRARQSSPSLGGY